MFTSFDQDKQFIWDKYHGFTAPAETGMRLEDITARLPEFARETEFLPPVRKANALAYLCRNLRFDVNSRDFFPTFDCWNRHARPIRAFINAQSGCLDAMAHRQAWADINASGAGSQWVDYDHSVPEWEYIIPIGFPGIIAGAAAARDALCVRQGGVLTPEQAAYFDGIRITYTAFLELLSRMAAWVRRSGGCSPRQQFVAAGLDALCVHPPRNTYQVLLFIYLYFMLSEHLDHYQVRSLGNLDNCLQPYFDDDIASGTFTEPQIRVLMDYFLMQWGGIDNYWGQPLYLGGTDERGNSRVNAMSRLILEEFDKLAIPTPKVQIKIAKNTPDDFIDQMLGMIRRGHNSLVFLSEEQIERVMTAHGFTREDARTCKICGCYEFGAIGEHSSNGTGVAHLNFLKPLEWLFNGGMDSRAGKPMGADGIVLAGIHSFDQFLDAYFAHLDWIIDTQIAVANDFEQYVGAINPANVFSAAVPVALTAGKDAFFNGSYVNASSMLGTGFASAADALSMIQEYVFDTGELTLQELAQCLQANWQGYEKLHGRIMKNSHRFGNGDARADGLMQRLVNHFADAVNGRPNARNGYWKASGHCAKQYFELGKKTMATPDGRFDGEEMSKNLSPVQGMDRQGITALLNSIASLDPVKLPGDFPLDVMLHPATVQGEDGLAVWRSLLRFYMDHGIAIHFNIFDAETLRAAQRTPEKYQGLQIRVCGWNVRFTTMAPVEQEMYIRRAENIAP